MAITRITIYGWILSPDDPVYGAGSGSLVDLIYFFDSDQVSVRDIFSIIEGAGFKIISKKIAGTKIPEQDRITIEDWSSHLKIGTEQIPPPEFKIPGTFESFGGI